MKDLNKRTEFDKQWEDAFEEAEMAPSEGVWDKIDSALSKEEAGYFRKRAFIYKLLAAASIVFALGVGIFSINYYLALQVEPISLLEKNNSEDQIRYDEDLSSIEIDAKNEVFGSVENQNLPDKAQPAAEMEGTQFALQDQINGTGELYGVDNSDIVGSIPTENSSLLLASNENSEQDDISGYGDNLLDQFNLKQIGRQEISLSSKEELILAIDHIYLIPLMPKGASKKKNDRESESGVFLAGLDFSTGVFNPNFEQGGGNAVASSGFSSLANTRVESVNDQLASFNATNKDFLLVRSAGKETEPDISYGYGANLGFKVTRRIILQTGIGYRKSNTTTTTTGYLEENGSDARIPIVASYQYQLDGLSSVNRIDETNLSNQYEFASIPLRAGYIFLDKKFNLTLLAGISSEFFLNNQIEDESNYLQSLSTSSGEGSPYKNVYFNGSLGTMLGYTFSKNYVITLEPSYRFAVNSFTNDDFYLNSYPSSFMVSFGVAYNFK